MKTEHWTDDQDLVELFASGSLTEERRKELEVHLNECDSCRNIVDREALLRKGIRHYARGNLKLRLRERLERAVVPMIPWPHVLSAAAVLIIVVGIGMQTAWQQPGGPVVHDADVGMADSVQNIEIRAPERDVPSAEDLQPVDDEGAGGVADEAAEISPREERRREIALRDARTPMAAAKSRTPPSESILWVTGTILTEASSARGEKEEAFAAGRQRAETPEPLLSKDRSAPRVSASQKPTRMLPQAQQMSALGIRQVLTAVEERNDSLHLTIFTDEADFQLEELQVDAVTDDSVVVSGGNGKLGVRIPDAVKTKIH